MAARNIRLNVAGQELEATLAAAQDSVAAAVASDEQIAEIAGESRQPDQPGAGTVSEWRRDAVEDVVRTAAALGFDMARRYPHLPRMEPEVVWVDGQTPVVHWPMRNIRTSAPRRIHPDSVSGRILGVLNDSPKSLAQLKDHLGETESTANLNVERRLRELVGYGYAARVADGWVATPSGNWARRQWLTPDA
jgi:hypothetical protein